MSPPGMFLLDHANACLAAGGGPPPRDIGFRGWLHIVGKDAGLYVFFALAFCLPILTAPIGVAAIVSWVLAIRRDYRLLRYGVVLTGQAQSVEDVVIRDYETNSGAAVRVLAYSFPTPDGRRIAGKSTLPRPTGVTRPPQPGQPVAVLYRDDDDYRILKRRAHPSVRCGSRVRRG